jgi:hypothetical protein
VVHTRLAAGRGPGRREALVVRIPHPFGPEHDIRQLLLEVAVAEAASAGVVRLAPPAPPSRREGGERSLVVATLRRMPVPVFVVAVLAAILYAVVGRP